jgi:pyruvate/oxaloacetate carboxyltransferase
LFDALNYIPNFKSSTNRLNWHKENGHPDIIIEGGFSYTTSPVHSTDVFVAFAEELQKKGCDTICSKDMAGLLEAKIADELIRKLIESPGLPVHLHDHDSCRRAEDVYLTGAKIAEETGAEVIIDVSFPPFAGGSAQPSILTMVEKLEAAGYSHGLNTKLLEEIAGYFHSILPNYEQHMKAGGVTPAQIIKSQIPGGMISNLVKQINAVGLSHLLDRALEEEVPRVRAEYGFPPLVTPTSQIIGIQAVMNLVATEIHGLERYYTGGGISKLTKTFLNNLVSGRTIDYFLGRYGQPPGEVDENVRDKVLSLAGKGAIPITDRPANHIPPGLKQATALAESVLGKGKATRADALICALYELDGPEYLKRQMAQGIR